MHVTLECPRCLCRLGAHADTSSTEIFDRMINDDPWFALGPGDTFAEMVGAALSARGRIRCPECGEPVLIRKRSTRRVGLEASADCGRS
jgi:DNA-directed RNA polymerase subunit RPC12/RpoP